MNGSAVYGERVVVVQVHSGHVSVKKGRISSTDYSHVQADNQNKTVVWGDRRFRPAAESPEDAHERSFLVDDIHLLKEQEAQALLDPANVQNRFGAVYHDHLVTKIHQAIRRLHRK
jgi:hypothetical protein